MDLTTNAHLANLATVMEFTLRLMSRCPELRSGLPVPARRAPMRPFFWRARVTHKLAFTVPPLAHIADRMRLGALAARGVEVGRMQYAGVADVGHIDETQRMRVLRASRTHAWCCSRTWRIL